MSVTDPSGKLGGLIPGVGAVASTFIAGVEAIKLGLAKPIGSMTQMSAIRLGKRTDNRVPKVNEFVPLEPMEKLVFTGWLGYPMKIKIDFLCRDSILAAPTHLGLDYYGEE